MLQRKDLAKEFELVVKQEIINYNNSLSSIYSLLDNLKNTTDDLKKGFNNEVQSLKNDAVKKQIECESEIQLLKSNIYNLGTRLNDILASIGKISSDIYLNIKEITKLSKNNEKNIDVIESLKINLSDLFKHVETIKTSHTLSLSQVKQKAEQDLKQVKQEILSQPSKIPEIESFFQNRLNELKVETEGYKKELLKVKRSQFVNEKKFENIYTLINRLKGEA